MTPPNKTNAFLVCDKCGRIINQWQDTCPTCNHDMMNVCVSYVEAKALSKRVRPKPQTGTARAYRRRAESPRERGPRVVYPGMGRKTPLIDTGSDKLFKEGNDD